LIVTGVDHHSAIMIYDRFGAFVFEAS
jgi:hypothetical protein